MIFNLFKSKPSLEEIIPKGFIDIHSHILPGLDDGSKTIEESLEILKKIEKLKFRKTIVTPHIYPGLHDNTLKTISDSYNKLITNYTGDIEINFASEYILGDYLIHEASKKELICISENYVLVEMSYISAPLNLYKIIFSIVTNGYIPVLAHPERYRYLFNNFNEYKKLKKVGCLFQLNILSTVGYYGNDIAKFSDKMLKENLFDFIGTDIHNINHIKKIKEKIVIKNYKKILKLTENNNIF